MTVETKLLPAKCIVDRLGKAVLRKAIFRIRRHRPGFSGLLRALSRQQDLFRWDCIFLEPVNAHAMTLKNVMELSAPKLAVGICLQDPGDTLVLDNWRILHGRSAIVFGTARRIERVYFSR
jgi:hypothetical protein